MVKFWKVKTVTTPITSSRFTWTYSKKTILPIEHTLFSDTYMLAFSYFVLVLMYIFKCFPCFWGPAITNIYSNILQATTLGLGAWHQSCACTTWIHLTFLKGVVCLNHSMTRICISPVTILTSETFSVLIQGLA